jgi:hypothetical protein
MPARLSVPTAGDDKIAVVMVRMTIMIGITRLTVEDPIATRMEAIASAPTAAQTYQREATRLLDLFAW